MPGPLGGVGRAPPDWVDEDEASVWDDIERDARRARRRDRNGAADDEDPPASARARGRGAAVASAARHYVGAERLRCDGEDFREDCSGFVACAYARAGLALSGGSAGMLELARELGVFHRRRRPSVGDVAFFENTYDANGNGKNDDEVTHVAVVVGVEEDGTIALVHHGSGGVGWLVMNLEHPDLRRSEGDKELNSFLRAEQRRDDPGTEYLAGELWIGFAAFWRALPER